MTVAAAAPHCLSPGPGRPDARRTDEGRSSCGNRWGRWGRELRCVAAETDRQLEPFSTLVPVESRCGGAGEQGWTWTLYHSQGRHGSASGCGEGRADQKLASGTRARARDGRLMMPMGAPAGRGRGARSCVRVLQRFQNFAKEDFCRCRRRRCSSVEGRDGADQNAREMGRMASCGLVRSAEISGRGAVGCEKVGIIIASCARCDREAKRAGAGVRER